MSGRFLLQAHVMSFSDATMPFMHKGTGMRCQICLKDFKKIRFHTKRISICGRCVQSLNGYQEVAEPSHTILVQRYEGAILRRANADLQSEDESTRERALWRLEHIGEIVARRMPDWLNRVLSDRKNASRLYKIIRAHRRGLLHFDAPRSMGYRSDFKEVARRVRLDDEYKCMECQVRNVELHVHHIIYKSNFGTWLHTLSAMHQWLRR